jgi:hypothetical protein
MRPTEPTLAAARDARRARIALTWLPPLEVIGALAALSLWAVVGSTAPLALAVGTPYILALAVWVLLRLWVRRRLEPGLVVLLWLRQIGMVRPDGSLATDRRSGGHGEMAPESGSESYPPERAAALLQITEAYAESKRRLSAAGDYLEPLAGVEQLVPREDAERFKRVPKTRIIVTIAIILGVVLVGSLLQALQPTTSRRADHYSFSWRNSGSAGWFAAADWNDRAGMAAIVLRRAIEKASTQHRIVPSAVGPVPSPDDDFVFVWEPANLPTGPSVTGAGESDSVAVSLGQLLRFGATKVHLRAPAFPGQVFTFPLEPTDGEQLETLLLTQTAASAAP